MKRKCLGNPDSKELHPCLPWDNDPSSGNGGVNGQEMPKIPCKFPVGNWDSSFGSQKPMGWPLPAPHFLSEVIMGNGGCKGAEIKQVGEVCCHLWIYQDWKSNTRFDHCFGPVILKTGGSLHSQEDPFLWWERFQGSHPGPAPLGNH